MCYQEFLLPLCNNFQLNSFPLRSKECSYYLSTKVHAIAARIFASISCMLERIIYLFRGAPQPIVKPLPDELRDSFLSVLPSHILESIFLYLSESDRERVESAYPTLIQTMQAVLKDELYFHFDLRRLLPLFNITLPEFTTDLETTRQSLYGPVKTILETIPMKYQNFISTGETSHETTLSTIKDAKKLANLLQISQDITLFRSLGSAIAWAYLKEWDEHVPWNSAESACEDTFSRESGTRMRTWLNLNQKQIRCFSISCQNDITYIPPEIFSLTSLQELHIVNCVSLLFLSKEISRLSSLEVLRITGNKKIQSLPPEIGTLSSLRVLDASGNSLSSIPSTLEKLTSLEELYLQGNSIEIDSIPQGVLELPQLTTFDLIARYPQEIPTYPSYLP